jgi:Lrp/AsnC family transcriptional regulator of lysine biosynthesis
MNDETDKKIIEVLKQNGRASNVELAKLVQLTEGAVRHRIEMLQQRGIIRKFTVELTTENEVSAVVMAKAKHETKKMMAEIINTKITDEAYEISGDYDACLIISGTNLDEIDKKIDKLRELKSVKDTKTFISLRKW